MSHAPRRPGHEGVVRTGLAAGLGEPGGDHPHRPDARPAGLADDADHQRRGRRHQRHSFERPGTLEDDAMLARDWFLSHFAQQP